MKFDSPLIEGVLLRRYKRFLADVQLPDGSVVTAHSSNTGSMMGCSTPGSRVWLRDSGNAKRKYPFTWELVEGDEGALVGINTLLANHLVEEAIDAGVVAELQGYDRIRREVRYGRENSRVDLLLERGDEQAWVEVKSVTLAREGVALFPDAVTTRGQKHLRELAEMAAQGHRAVIFFCIQREDVRRFAPADAIDPAYGELLREVMAAGVEALAYRARVDTQGIRLERSVTILEKSPF